MAARMKKQQGYVVDLPYSFSFYKEMQPLWLSSVLQFAGLQAPEPDQPFRYCELGCGLAVNLLVAAALYPQGHFVGVDFNAAQLQLAERAIEDAGLTNIELIHCDFAGFAKLQQQPFDFIVSHGTWSWVSPVNQQQLLEIVQRNLNPGGVLYLHYMCYPGADWMRPVQKLFKQLDESCVGQPSAHSIELAKQLLLQLNSAGVFQHQQGMTEHLTALCQRDANYLAHEFLTDYWLPEHSVDLHQRVNAIGLSYLCSANLFDNLESLSIPGAVQPILATLQDAALRESLKDLARNQKQRQDLFQRLPRPLEPAQQLNALQQMQFRCVRPVPDPLVFHTPIGDIAAPAALFDALLQLVHQGNCSFQALQQLPEFQGRTSLLLQALHMLIWAGYLHPLLPIHYSASQQLQQQQLMAWFRQQNIALQLLPSCGTAIPISNTNEFTI